MSRLRPWLFTGLLLGSITFTVMGQNSPLSRPGSPTPSATPGRFGPGGKPAAQNAAPLPGNDPSARTFMTQAQGLLGEGRATEAKEAMKTALRLEPMNIEAWNLYDRAVEAEYLVRAREEKISPVVDRDLKPIFAIDKVESYTEYNSLFVVGEVRNMSDTLRQRVELSAQLFDENKQELRKESGVLRLKDRGLFPSESSLFEIEFTNPPPGVKSFRVRVVSYE